MIKNKKIIDGLITNKEILDGSLTNKISIESNLQNTFLKGVGVDHITFNDDYSFTIVLTNGEQYTTEPLKGDIGATPNIQIGTIQTLAPGRDASATISGTPENPILNLAIPRGAVGEKGETGIVPHISIGTVENLPPERYTYVTRTGPDQAPIFHFGIVRGQTGQQGPQGIQGPKGDKGDTPIKGTDYWTATDKNEIVNDIAENFGYQTADDVTAAIANALDNITGIEYHVCTSLEYNNNTRIPTLNGETGVIYLVPKETNENNNIYYEYIYNSNSFEKIGDTTIDLSEYLKNSDIAGNTDISNMLNEIGL